MAFTEIKLQSEIFKDIVNIRSETFACVYL